MEKFTEEELNEINLLLKNNSLVSHLNNHLGNLTNKFVVESVVLKRKDELHRNCDSRICRDGSRAIEVCDRAGYCTCWCPEDDE